MSNEEVKRKIYLSNLEFHNELTPLTARYLRDEITTEEYQTAMQALESYWEQQLVLELEDCEE